MLLMQAQENGVVLDEEQLLFLAGGQDNAIDEDVDEQPVQDLALNVDNVFQADDYDAYDSDVDEAYHDDVQPSYVVGSHADYTSDSNMTPYDQYVKDNAVPVVQNNASMVLNDMNQVKLYKDVPGTSVCILQLASTIKHNKLMVDEVTSLKKDFNQKENKYLEEFLDLKALKDKVEDKLFKQGQSIQTVHMMCKPRSYYDEVNKVAIGYKNPLCLHRARQVQPALYSGHVIVTPNHAPAVVRDGEETLELTKISRKKMHDKMKANECVDNKIVQEVDFHKKAEKPQAKMTKTGMEWKLLSK
ncbi:hypothetical protein Tco_0630944 [Tanacetum coccineum]